MRIVVIPAAGSATRFKELGKQYAKTVLPYKGKPIIVHIVEQVTTELNPDRIRIVYSRDDHKDQIQQSLDMHNLTAEFVKCDGGRQGPGKSILSGIPSDVTDEDELYVHLSDFVAADKSVLNIAVNSIASFVVNDPSRWCVISLADDKITGFVDKPKTRQDLNIAVAGLYRFSNAKLFRDVGISVPDDKSGEYNISELMDGYLQKIPLTISMINETSLIDFGTIEEYIKNRGIAKTRSFNKLTELKYSVIKSSSINPEKINDECTWMKAVPYGMERFTPRVYWQEYGSFEMEKIKSTNLRDLYLYLDRSKETWDEIFDSVWEFIYNCSFAYVDVKENRFWEKIIEKTKERSGNEYPEFCDRLASAIRSSRFYNKVTFYHGDLHFANMFYCFTYKELKFVDPRGELTGHWFYDLAKINHSVNGKYDWIDSQLYSDSVIYDRGTEDVKFAFNKFIGRFNFRQEELDLLNMLTSSLFLSMIPLHNHSKENQKLFLDEFLRLEKSSSTYLLNI